MTAITYGATPAAKAAPANSIWVRLWNAFVEARMKQAMREVALHRHLLPAELEAKFNYGSAKVNP